MNTVNEVIQAASMSRGYVTQYRQAIESKKLDSALFATMAEQQAFFRSKIQEFSRPHRDNLRRLRDLYSAGLLEASPERREEIKLILAGIDSEIEAL